MKINNYVVSVLVIVVVFTGFAFLVVPNRKESVLKDEEGISKIVELPPYLFLVLDCPIEMGLYRTIYKRDPVLLSNYKPYTPRPSLGEAFRKLKETGKASGEEVEAVIEFEKAKDDLTNAMSKIGDIPSLCHEIRF